MSAKDDAIKLIDEFEKRDKNPCWIHLKTEDAAYGLRQRVMQPNIIDSSKVNLCGPAAFFRILAGDDPVAFAKFAISLHESGSATIGTLTVKTSSWIWNYKAPTGLDQVDWMLLASLRDSENKILRFESVADGASGITLPSGLASWFTKAGYTGVQNVTNLLLTKDFEDLDKASALRTHGYRICLFINSDMLKSATQSNRSVTPDHWVVLDSSVVQGAKTGTASFKVWSWGKIMPVPEFGSITESEVARNFYGYVAVKK